MSIKYTNLTYKELMELAPRDKPFQVVVQSNPFGEGGKQTLWACLDNTEEHLNTEFCGQTCVGDIDYGFLGAYNPDTRKHVGVWEDQYKGTFDLIIHHLDDTTLEKYEVGDRVELTEGYKSSKEYIECTCQEFKDRTSDYMIIDKIYNDEYGIYYTLDISPFRTVIFPHNYLRKLNPTKEKPQTIQIGDRVKFDEGLSCSGDFNESGQIGLVIDIQDNTYTIKFEKEIICNHGGCKVKFPKGYICRYPGLYNAKLYSKADNNTIQIGGETYEVTKELTKALKNLKKI